MHQSQIISLSNSAISLVKAVEGANPNINAEEDKLDELEVQLVRQMIALGNPDLFEDDELLHPENIDDDTGLYRHELCVKALENISERIGRWDSK